MRENCTSGTVRGVPGNRHPYRGVRAIAEYAAHYHEERSHQGIGNEMINGATPQSEGIIEVRDRLGGLLKYYHRRAA